MLACTRCRWLSHAHSTSFPYNPRTGLVYKCGCGLEHAQLLVLLYFPRWISCEYDCIFQGEFSQVTSKHVQARVYCFTHAHKQAALRVHCTSWCSELSWVQAYCRLHVQQIRSGRQAPQLCSPSSDCWRFSAVKQCEIVASACGNQLIGLRSQACINAEANGLLLTGPSLLGSKPLEASIII